jgi:hypothetical protein
MCVCARGRSVALGVSDASKRREQGGVHGRTRAGLAWGIDPGCRGESGGEVIGQETDGGLLTKRGCPRWPWRWPGRREVLASRRC